MFLLTLFLCVIASVKCYFITIDAHAEECFFEKVTDGTKLGVSFEVAEGGFLDIDFKITGPDGNSIHESERESNGRYTFPASMDGIYTFCFSNKMSTMTPKIVMFTVDVGESHAQNAEGGGAGADDTEGGKKLEDMIKELSAALSGVKHEQDYMEVREKVHRAINDNTNSRVVLWSFFEALVLIAMTCGQIYYLKQFFEVRRVV
ncbi:UNVERIFIED_CONTAM: hypothetical protein RMT77_003656 [Armadillidium vulgare]